MKIPSSSFILHPSSLTMIAWALSGGGNRGPIQVGAMRALFERNIVPDFLVGTSAGALNAAYIAANPTAQTNEALAQVWLGTRAKDIFPKPRFIMILRALLFGNGLDDNKARTKNFMKYLPNGVSTFGDLKVPLYLTSADLQTGRLYLYGDDPTAKLVEAGLASTALPVVWDPEIINGHQFVDGGVVAHVPISVAMDRGATTIYALDLQDGGPYVQKKGVIQIALHTIGVQTYQQALRDIQRAVDASNVTLHYISLGDIFSSVELQDFSHTAEMIEQGYQRTKEYLDNPKPNRLPRSKPGVLGVDELVPDDAAPPGAVPYQPRF
jgi:NTE family protein